MVPVEIILGTAATLGAIGTALFGGGLLKQLFSHSNAMAVQKHELEQTKIKVDKNDSSIQQLQIDVKLQNKDILSFAEQVKKLDLLPEISGKLTGIEMTMAYMKEHLGMKMEKR